MKTTNNYKALLLWLLIFIACIATYFSVESFLEITEPNNTKPEVNQRTKRAIGPSLSGSILASAPPAHPKLNEPKSITPVQHLPDWMRENLRLRGRFIDPKFGVILSDMAVKAGIGTDETCAYLNEAIKSSLKKASEAAFSIAKPAGSMTHGGVKITSFLMPPNAEGMKVIRTELVEKLARVIPAADLDSWTKSILAASAFASFSYQHSLHLVEEEGKLKIITIGGNMPVQTGDRPGVSFEIQEGNVDDSPYLDHKKLIISQSDNLDLFSIRWDFLLPK